MREEATRPTTTEETFYAVRARKKRPYEMTIFDVDKRWLTFLESPMTFSG